MLTGSLSVSPHYDYPKEKAPVLIGNTASYQLTVTVRKLDMISTVLDELVEAGANKDVSVGFGCSNPEKALEKARIQAVADARKRANLYVNGAGAALGQVLTISEGQAMPWREYRFDHMPKAMEAQLPIAVGQQELSVSVTVTYAIVHTAGSPKV
jgi:uncharacterized protein YggE